jgi:hypothetical protein
MHAMSIHFTILSYSGAAHAEMNDFLATRTVKKGKSGL